MQEAIRRLDSGHEGADANSSLRLSLYDHLAFAEFKVCASSEPRWNIFVSVHV